MIDALKQVAGGKAEKPAQVTSCAKALTTVTSKADEVTQEAKVSSTNVLFSITKFSTAHEIGLIVVMCFRHH